jgi:hypothetical protein
LALSETERLILVAILAGLMLFVVFFELRVMRSKSKEVRIASQRKDEAFNAVLTTRSVMNSVRNRGGKVGNAPAILDLAKEALNRGNYDSCISYCDKAKSEIVTPKRTLKGAPEPEDEDEPGGDLEAKERLEAVAENIVSKRSAAAEGDSYKGTKLTGPKEGNYLGAKFEISTAKSDIARAAKSHLETSSAEGLLVEAEAAYTAGDYDKALSLAVRSRKAIGSEPEEEVIPLRGENERPAPAEPKVFDVEEPKAPGARLCPVCAADVEPEDMFCPKCGAKVPKKRVCPACGAKPKSTDSFCRKCGAKID